LVALKVDAIVVQTTPAALAVKQAPSTIPIVIASAIDPVGAGLAKSLARPGGNVTGLAFATTRNQRESSVAATASTQIGPCRLVRCLTPPASERT